MCTEQNVNYIDSLVLILMVNSQVFFDESFFSKLLEELLTEHMTYGMDHSQAVDRQL